MGLYRKSSHITGLAAFTERFSARVIEMAGWERETGVRVEAARVACSMSAEVL